MLFRSSKRSTPVPTGPSALDSLALDEADIATTEAPPKEEPLATLEILGSTAIATVTVNELTGANASTLISDLLTEFAEARVRHFVFDLQNVTYMDSACIGVMVEMLTRIQTAGGRIALVNAGQSVSYLFKLTRLDRLFPICRDVMQAIAAVERGGAH